MSDSTDERICAALRNIVKSSRVTITDGINFGIGLFLSSILLAFIGFALLVLLGVISQPTFLHRP